MIPSNEDRRTSLREIIDTCLSRADTDVWITDCDVVPGALFRIGKDSHSGNEKSKPEGRIETNLIKNVTTKSMYRGSTLSSGTPG